MPTEDGTSPNVTWQQGNVERARRRRLLGHHGATVWLTGLSASGKTTIAVALEEALFARGVAAYRLDGDNLRQGLCSDLRFSAEDRDENVRRAGETARLFADAGLVALASFISPYREGRARCRRMHQDAGLAFVEAYVDCPLELAEQRDPKGLYKKARLGLLRGFTGIDDPYEPPLDADVHLRTDRMDVPREVALLLAALEAASIIDPVGP